MQKITPFLWYDHQAEEAMNFYMSLFPNSKMVSMKRYPTDMQVGPVPNMGGKVLTEVFEIGGYRLMALDGGPFFTFTPSTSISVQCKDEAEIDALYAKLVDGGMALMELQNYGFSKKYAWVNDRYGLSWQINLPNDPSTITHKFAEFKMFHGANAGKAEEAMNFYVSVFPDSKVGNIWRHENGESGGTPGTVAHGEFTLCGQQFMVTDSTIDHKFDTTGALSLLVECKDQEEIDRYWEALSADPASEQCGWCKDKYGFSWQIVPDMSKWMDGPDAEGNKRALQAMLGMKKIDITALEAAYNG